MKITGKILTISSLFVSLALAVCFFASCRKDDRRCENWEFEDVCVPKVASADCYAYVHRVSSICDQELADAQGGKTSIIVEDSTRVIERHYIRRAN